MKRGQTVKTALVLALAAGVLSVSAAAFSRLPDPGFSLPVPEGWGAGQGDLLRPAMGEANPGRIILEDDSKTEITIVDGEAEGEGGVKLFLLG